MRLKHRRTLGPTRRLADAPSYRLVFFLFTPFLASIIAAWAWFNTGIGRPQSRDQKSDDRSQKSAPSSVLGHPSSGLRPSGIWLFPLTNLPEYHFIPETVSTSVMKTLGTADILSGTFVRNQQTDANQKSPLTSDLRLPTSDLLSTDVLATDAPTPVLPGRVTVFLATWPAGRCKPMTMLGHTPDVCWRGSGWKPINLGQPKQNFLAAGGADIKFETRIFESPNQREREAAVWCTLVGGRPFDELGAWRDETAIRGGYRNLVLNRLLRFKQMSRILWERAPIRGSKQFVRFSTEMTDPWPITFEKLRAFGSLWL